MMVTVDTNILVYATTPAEEPLRSRAKDIVKRLVLGGHPLMLQTLGEYCNVTLRKLRTPADEVQALVETWRAILPVHAAEPADLLQALDVVQRHRLQFWDAMLWATARRVGVRHIFSEDFQDGRALDGVTFLNPFNPANDALIDRILAQQKHSPRFGLS